MRKNSLLTFLLAISIVGFLIPPISGAQTVTKTEEAGPVSVTLKVLPAESFKGPKAAMMRDGGAEPMLLSHSPRPNHHMVVFIKREMKPVERARVMILYRQYAPNTGKWTLLPVVRMHVAGKGLATTHFGNNVRLMPGDYEVIVVVDHNPPADFHIKLSK